MACTRAMGLPATAQIAPHSLFNAPRGKVDRFALTVGFRCSSARMAAASDKSSTDASPAAEPASKGVGVEEGAAVAAAPDLEPSEEGRHVFAHQGKKVYEWSQTLEDINLFLKPPPGVRAKDLEVTISTDRFSIGLKGNAPFLDEELASTINEDESLWTMDGEELSVTMVKAAPGETWRSVFKSHGHLDEAGAMEMQKKLMLERFQAEHPGFDFSNAEFNGSAPDPRTFMGGMKST